MEKLKTRPEESPAPRIEEIDSKIRNLLNPIIGKEEWREEWNNPQFVELFPNIVQRLLYKEYPEPDRKRMFELAFPSFMELFSTRRSVHLSGTIFTLSNDPLPMWQKPASQNRQRLDTETLSTIEIGSLVSLGLSLDDKKSAKNLILEHYEVLKETNKHDTKPRNFRSSIVRLMTEKNLFRTWVKANHIDQNYGFDWDIAIPDLVLTLLPFRRTSASNSDAPSKLPPEFTSDLKIFPPVAIDVLSTHALEYAQRLSLGGHRSKDLRDFLMRMQELDPNHFRDCPDLLDAVKIKIAQINNIISSPK